MKRFLLFLYSFFFFGGMEHCDPPQEFWLSGRAPTSVRPGLWFDPRLCTDVLLNMMGGWVLGGWMGGL